MAGQGVVLPQVAPFQAPLPPQPSIAAQVQAHQVWGYTQPPSVPVPHAPGLIVGPAAQFRPPAMAQGRAPIRRPSFHQLAYNAGPLVNGLGPNQLPEHDARPPAQQTHFTTKSSWNKMTKRMQQLPYSCAPLVTLWNVRSGKFLPCFIYTRRTVNLQGSCIDSNDIPIGFRDPAAPAQGQQANLIPVTVRAPNIPKDDLNNFFFVPATPETVLQLPMTPLPSAVTGNVFVVDIIKLDNSWLLALAAIRAVLTSCSFLSGCWWQDKNNAAVLEANYTAARITYVGGYQGNLQYMRDVEAMYDGFTRNLATALHEGFSNSAGRAAMDYMMRVIQHCVDLQGNQMHLLSPPDVYVHNNTHATQYSYLTTSIDSSKLNLMYLQGEDGALPFHVVRAGVVAGPPAVDHFSKERLRTLRRKLAQDYDADCPFPQHYKCSVPNAPKFVDVGMVCRMSVNIDANSNAARWQQGIPGVPMDTSCQPFAIEVVGRKDSWGEKEAYKGAVIAALDTLCYQDRAYVVLMFDTNATIMQVARSDKHEIRMKQEHFQLTGNQSGTQNNRVATAQTQWRLFMERMLDAYVDAIVVQAATRHQNAKNQVQNNGFFHQQLQGRGATPDDAHNASPLHIDVNRGPGAGPAICCHIHSPLSLDLSKTFDGRLPVDD